MMTVLLNESSDKGRGVFFVPRVWDPGWPGNDAAESRTDPVGSNLEPKMAVLRTFASLP
jgi:deoxycytidine triphosphate deaminase